MNDITLYENKDNIINDLIHLKVRYDGSFFYGTPIIYNEKNKGKTSNRNINIFNDELNEYYLQAKLNNLKKYDKVVNFMSNKFYENHKDDKFNFNDDVLKDMGDVFSQERYNALKKSIYKRKKRFKDKAYFNDWNYFTTITYDDKLFLDSDDFKSKLLKKLSNFKCRYGLKYILVFENGDKNDRLHAHLLMNINEHLKEILNINEKKHYNLKSKKLEVWNESKYFKLKFGRNQFDLINNKIIRCSNVLDYILKYISKTNNKLHYCRGLAGDKNCLVSLYNDVILSYTSNYNQSYFILNWDVFRSDKVIEDKIKFKELARKQKYYNDDHNIFMYASD